MRDLRQVAALLEGLRALGSGRVLDEVLALVLDSAIEVTGAERGFIMLRQRGGALELKLAARAGSITLPGTGFETSRKIPEEVFTTGEQKIVTDLLDGDLAASHMGTVALGIRHVLCTPLRLVRYLESRRTWRASTKRIGVLYLDSREKGTPASPARGPRSTRSRPKPRVAIENARLYRETVEKARLEQELSIAAEIQQALLPEAHTRRVFEAVAASIPCRAIGGDFFDYVELPDGGFGFALGDVAGKGPPAALLTAVIQGIFSAFRSIGDDSGETVDHGQQGADSPRIEARFATMLYGVLAAAGNLTYSNARPQPADDLSARRGVRRIEDGGMHRRPVRAGALRAGNRVSSTPATPWSLFSDGVTEAMNVAGEEFGEHRLVVVSSHLEATADGCSSAARRGRDVHDGRRAVRRRDGARRTVHGCVAVLWLTFAASFAVFCFVQDRVTAEGARRYVSLQAQALRVRGGR